MKIYQNPDDYKASKPPIVTVGTFDGVHSGHRKIFRRMKELAAKSGGETVVVTFHPHPRLVVSTDHRNLRFINTIERKYELIAETGIHHLVIIPFTKEFSMQSSEEFIRNYLISKIGLQQLVIGYDHHFGRDREGDILMLNKMGKQYGFSVEEVPAHYVHNIPVSSTQIRNALKLGDLKLANELLGYDYSITGKVVHGKKIGRAMGFPTANIDLKDEYKIISAVGVYACRAYIDGKFYKGMGNIGYRPTVDHGDLTVEIHIFDYNRDIYGEKISIYFIERIRDEIKFPNLEALRQQLIKDRSQVERLIG
ncbi:MAG: bifunctional riboflavin kinase/FAD synthetase [Bacteroidetes bacterium]|nr:bifunctional riboflavin kinase/FAD synthetase [Bacteroidota bacterium]